MAIGSQDSDIDIGLPEERDELIIESLVRGRTLYLEIKYIIVSNPNLQVTSFSASMLNSDPLPSWLSVDRETGFIRGEPPVDVETLQLRIEVSLNDGTIIVRYVEVEVTNGEISLVRDIADSSDIGTSLFSEQVMEVADRFTNSAKEILAVLPN